MFKRFKVLFFILIFLGISIFYTVWAGEHVAEPVESGEIKKQMEQKQQDLDYQRQKRAEAETDLKNAREREQKATEELSQYGYVSWGLSKVWGGEYDKLVDEQIDAKSLRDSAQNDIDTAQKKIDQLQQEMAALSQQYAPAVSTQDISTLKNQMNAALKNRDFKSFNDALQQIIEQTPNPADKYDPITNAIDAVVKEYPNDLTAQSDALKQIELTLNLMLGKDYKSNDYKEVINDIVVARQKVQAKIDEHSPWYMALKNKNILTFRDSLKTLFNQKKTDEDKRILLRDVFNQVSANIALGSTQWFDFLDDIFKYSADIPTEKAGVDLKAELLFSAIDLINANLPLGGDNWRHTLNTLYDSYTDPLYYPEIQKRIKSELEKQRVKIENVNLGGLLKQGNIVDYVDAVEDSVAKLATADAKRELIENQYVTVAGELGVNNYPEQIDVLAALSSAVDPTNFAPIDKPKVQDTFNIINDRKEVLEGRLESGNNNLGNTLNNAPGPLELSTIVDEEIHAAKQLHQNIPGDPQASYEARKFFLTDVNNTIVEYKDPLMDLSRTDITNQLNEINNLKPQPSTFINDLEKELNLGELVLGDQIAALQRKYNDAINQLTIAVEKNDVNSVKNIRDNLQQIKDLIDNDKYKSITQHNETLAKNVDAGIDFANNLIDATKPIELTTEEKNVLTKLTTGEALNAQEAALLAGIGAKKVLSFVSASITSENLENVDTIAAVLEKTPLVASILGKLLQRLDTVINASSSDNWYIKILLGGSTLIAAPLVKRYLTAQYGESVIGVVEKIMNKVPEAATLANSASFQNLAKSIETGAKVTQSATGLLENLKNNVNLNADAKNIENIPPKELPAVHDTVSTLARRLEQLGAFDPDTTTKPEETNVPTEQKGFFGRIKDYLSSFVDDVKKWITSIFAGDTGIPTLEKKFAAAQNTYNKSNTQANAQALVIAAQNLHAAYQEVMNSIVTYKQLGSLWNDVVMDKNVATALQKDPINMEILNQAATAVLESQTYNAAFIKAMNEINAAVSAASKGTALENIYPTLFDQLVMKNYASELSTKQQKIKELNDAFAQYQSQLQDAIAKAKQPTTPTQGEIPQGQPDILGTG